MVVVKGGKRTDLERAYQVAVDLQRLVDQVSSDEDQAEIERLLARFRTVIRRGRIHALDHS